MKKVGLVSKTTLSYEEEDEAWIKYQDHQKYWKLILGRGMYEIQLRLWFKYFPREQFLILKSEDLDHDRATTMSRVYRFLGVPDQVLEKDEKVHTRNYSKPVLDKVQAILHDFYRPYNRRLESVLGPEWKDVWERPSS
jgi:Sulfotransferase domain